MMMGLGPGSGPPRKLELVSSSDAPMSRGPGDGGGNMEQRVTAIEKRLDRFETKQDTLLERIGSVEGKVSMLPGYPGIAVIVSIIVGAVGLALKFLPVAH